MRVIVANVGCGGPHPPERRAWAATWLASATIEKGDILLLQEVPVPELTGLLPQFDVFTADLAFGDYGCRSIVAVRRGRGLNARAFTLETAAYHGSYVASALVSLPPVGDVVVLSVHASPTRPTANERSKWSLALPPERNHGGELWNSDFVLATVRHLVDTGHEVLAGGDFNEARDWDLLHLGSWGEDYFGAMDAEGARLRDCTFRRWGTEFPTHDAYQDDHVLATPTVDDLIDEARLGERPPAHGSDHRSIELILACTSDRL